MFSYTKHYFTPSIRKSKMQHNKIANIKRFWLLKYTNQLNTILIPTDHPICGGHMIFNSVINTLPYT